MTAGRSRAGSLRPFPAVLCAVVLMSGCAGIRVRRAEGPTVTGSWRASALSCNGLSPRTLQTLRRYDLEHLYPAKLSDIVEKLHEQAVKDNRSELLFALAEVNYLRGLRAERDNSPDACTYY